MSGHRAVITGASLSIGRSIALGLADHGAAIAVNYSAAADKAFGRPPRALGSSRQALVRSLCRWQRLGPEETRTVKH
jgi:NAD(P)-dependent dehydrogenase (short-subunit alcohol dehydrogenase family)